MSLYETFPLMRHVQIGRNLKVNCSTGA